MAENAAVIMLAVGGDRFTHKANSVALTAANKRLLLCALLLYFICQAIYDMEIL